MLFHKFERLIDSYNFKYYLLTVYHYIHNNDYHCLHLLLLILVVIIIIWDFNGQVLIWQFADKLWQQLELSLFCCHMCYLLWGNWHLAWVSNKVKLLLNWLRLEKWDNINGSRYDSSTPHVTIYSWHKL